MKNRNENDEGKPIKCLNLFKDEKEEGGGGEKYWTDLSDGYAVTNINDDQGRAS